MRIFLFCSVATLILITVLLFTSLAAIAEGSDPHHKISLSLSLGKSEAYPGESVPVTVTLRIYDAIVRNIGYPRLDSPNGKTVVFAPPVQESDTGDPGVILQRFTGQISGVKTGKRIIGPAHLDCEVMKPAAGSAAFFGGQEPEPVRLTSTSVPFAVLPLPTSGKPEHFSGAIGTFSLSVKSLPAEIATGEPLTVTTTIRGDGSLGDAACPTITGPDLQSFPVQATRGAAQLVCEQIVVPKREKLFPPVVWSFFYPQKQQYRVLSTNIVSRVKAPLPNPQAAAVSTTPVTAASSHKSPAYSSHLQVIVVTMSALLVLVGMSVRMRKKTVSEATLQHYSSDIKAMLLVAEGAALNKDVEIFYNTVHEILQVVEKYYNNSFALTASKKANMRSILCENNKKTDEQSSSDAIRALTIVCDKVRYGRTIPDSSTISSDFEFLRQILSDLSKLITI
jgi:hypothetical protein